LERAVYWRKANKAEYVAASTAFVEAATHSFLVIGGGAGRWDWFGFFLLFSPEHVGERGGVGCYSVKIGNIGK
jgi:hypothetical protein